MYETYCSALFRFPHRLWVFCCFSSTLFGTSYGSRNGEMFAPEREQILIGSISSNNIYFRFCNTIHAFLQLKEYQMRSFLNMGPTCDVDAGDFLKFFKPNCVPYFQWNTRSNKNKGSDLSILLTNTLVNSDAFMSICCLCLYF